MLEFLVAAAESFERHLIAHAIVGGADVALDQPEYVRVGSALNLAHEATFVGLMHCA